MVFINRGAGNLPRVSPSNNLLYLTTKKITCQLFTVHRAHKEILAQSHVKKEILNTYRAATRNNITKEYAVQSHVETGREQSH